MVDDQGVVILSNEYQQRQSMLTGQILPNRVTTEGVLSAINAVERESYVPTSLKGVAYTDASIPLGHGRFMLEPMKLGRLIDAAEIKSTDVILDVGCGSGYSSAVLSKLGEVVVGLESNDELFDKATENLNSQGVDNAVVVKGDLSEGVEKQGPFDVIFINGAVEVLPSDLITQLADGGRLVTVYVEDGVGHGYKMQRTGEEVEGYNLFDAMVPVLPEFSKNEDFAF